MASKPIIIPPATNGDDLYAMAVSKQRLLGKDFRATSGNDTGSSDMDMIMCKWTDDREWGIVCKRTN
ncbi:hypothetical protein L873DRAFT_1803203, partial [Choiromyces venosus 120613-1]